MPGIDRGSPRPLLPRTRTQLEAGVSLLYEELDGLISRVEEFRGELPKELARAQLALIDSTDKAQGAMNDAATKLIASRQAFDATFKQNLEREKSTLASYIQATTQQAAATAVEAEKRSLERVRDAFNEELDQRVAALKASLKMAAERPLVPRMFELAIAAALGGVVSVFCVGVLLHFLGLLPTR